MSAGAHAPQLHGTIFRYEFPEVGLVLSQANWSGDVGDEKAAGATPVNQTELDANCAIFEGISAPAGEFSL